jgi:RHS repeat-associated protein
VAAVHVKEKGAKEKTLYLHGDALGSVRVVSNEAGGEEQRVYLEPYGGRVDSDGSPVAANFTPAVEVGFTGHHHDDDLGFINAQGRVYDPAIRRFLTPDPIVSFPLFGQSFNRYSYALNSPLSFTDPSGFSANDNRGQAPRDGPPSISAGSPNLGGKMVRPMGKAQSPPKSVPPGMPKGSSDASGQTPDTGATAAPGQAVAEAPAPAAEVPSAPASPAPAAGATAGGSAAHRFPPTFAETQAELEPPTWRDSTPAQVGRGAALGTPLGMVPALGIAEQVITGVGLRSPGTKAEQNTL